MRLMVSEILAKAKEVERSGPEVQASVLQRNDCPALRQILRWYFDPLLQWNLPEGTLPFKRAKYPTGINLHTEAKKLYLFIKPHPTERFHKTLVTDSVDARHRKEKVFIMMMENLEASESDLILDLINRQMDFVSKEVVNLAFPGLLPPQLPAEEKPAEIELFTSEIIRTGPETVKLDKIPKSAEKYFKPKKPKKKKKAEGLKLEMPEDVKEDPVDTLHDLLPDLEDF